MSQLFTSTRDAVVKALVAAELPLGLQPVAIYDLAFRLEELTGGRFVVCPQTKDPTLATRGAGQTTKVLIDVAVQYKFPNGPTAQDLDPYLNLAEQVGDTMLTKSLSNGAVCVGFSFPHGAYLQEHIKQFGVLTSVVTLTFLVGD